MPMNKEIFVGLVRNAVSNEVSDIHLRQDEKPSFRLRGDLVTVKMEPLSDADMRAICQVIIKDEDVLAKLAKDKLKEYDGSYAIPGVCRVRINFMRYQGKMGLILRIISDKIPTSDELGLPEAINKIASAGQGLVLVTGATGSGKSSTLAAMINYINRTQPVHILT